MFAGCVKKAGRGDKIGDYHFIKKRMTSIINVFTRPSNYGEWSIFVAGKTSLYLRPEVAGLSGA